MNTPTATLRAVNLAWQREYELPETPDLPLVVTVNGHTFRVRSARVDDNLPCGEEEIVLTVEPTCDCDHDCADRYSVLTTEDMEEQLRGTWPWNPSANPTRTATVERSARITLELVRDYLPSNYAAREVGDLIIIRGQDDHGWTMEGYVIPRLASAGIPAKEVQE